MKGYKDPDKLRRMYVTKSMSSVEISRKYDVTPKTVLYWLNKHDIPTRKSPSKKPPHYHTGPQGYERLDTKIGDDRYTVLVHRLLMVAEDGFDAVVDKDVHHLNGLPWDNRPSNVVALEHGEHATVTNEGREYS